VAAGFFVDTSTEAFNYYPVRTDMAHAWAEVWFPGYGWIEYDPTSEIIAEGEDFRFSEGTPPELFERLMKEILENRSRLKIKEGEAVKERSNLAAIGAGTIRFLNRWGLPLVIIALAILFLALRSLNLLLSFFHHNCKKKALYLWAHTKRRLALAGFGRLSNINQLAEYQCFAGLYSLYLDSAAAKFAPVYTKEDFLRMEEHYRLFSAEYRKSVPAFRRLLAWLIPPLALVLKPGVQKHKTNGSVKNKTNGSHVSGIILVIIILFSLRGETIRMIAAQDGRLPAESNADTLYQQALNAQYAENWERAIELFSTGSRTFPDDFRFPWSLGNLYYNRSLYRLAWDEYRRAENIDKQEPDLLIRLAFTAGFLNRNSDSAAYLERLLDIEPDNMNAIGILAWMYFKLHRLQEGERLLLNAMEHYGYEEDFAMTLGTIYSDMFRYRESKEFYLMAIRGAEMTANRLLASQSHYNLSILESRFYKFSLAYERTNASLEALNRASGRLARGELYLRRLEISRALAEYQDAYATDNSPLSKLNLAEAFQIGGRLTEAVLYAEDCLKAGDESWMLNYGIDPVRYRRDIHEILMDSYRGLFKAEAFSCTDLRHAVSVKEIAKGFFRKIHYRFKEAVHTRLFRKYSLLSADAYRRPADRTDGIHIEALTQYFHAFKAYPRRAMDYLSAARDFEEPLIPASVPSYDFEEGSILKNRKLLDETLGGFDPLWERDIIARVYAELADGSMADGSMTAGGMFAGSTRAEKRDAAERLFALNRGALLQNGIRLPVAMNITGVNSNIEEILYKAAMSGGLDPQSPDKKGAAAPRYTLNMKPGGEETILCELYDGGRGNVVFRQNLPLPPGANWFETRSRKTAFARALRDEIFDAF
jgi:tetratricopeptide (TPR) repeat protein